MWRLVRPEKGPGLFVWFDPECESIQLTELSPECGVPSVREEDALDALGYGPIPSKTAEPPAQLPLF